ncbi:MAG: HdeD family acid-resistance protein [Candidatus Fimadaptatus sp.]|jgi:uncharacterized membrane protein HdeD (DUF308 family)
MMFKKIRWSMILTSMLTILLGLVMLFFPGVSALAVCIMFGAALTIDGIVKLIGYFSKDDMGYMFRYDLISGVVQLITGILLLMHPRVIMAAIPVVLGIALVCDCLIKGRLALGLKREGYGMWWLSMLAAVLEAVMAILMIANPFPSASAIFIMIGVAAVISGAIELINVLRISNTISRFFDGR